MRWASDFVDWFDDRTGIRTARKHLLDEPLPPGVGWWFVTGSVLLMLLIVQLITGVILTMYYVPSPEFAYDSVRFIMERVIFGRVLRGLHFFGASFIVIAAIVHMVRVVALGSYKKPREVTWVTGVVLLLVILGFALTGYLLPWDQKAYWATTVTVNIARSGPFGTWVSALMKGGNTLGSLTLLRWYSVHVFVLPATLIAFVVAHLYLMRRHGISGALKPVPGTPKPFYPYHAYKDTIVSALVFWGAGSAGPGWLVRCLSEFAFRGVNLSKIESRPLRSTIGHYRFFVDCDDGLASPAVSEAVDGLRTHCTDVRVLGSYPRELQVD